MTCPGEPRRRTLSIAWNPRSWSRARAAYVVQLDADPPGEPTMLRWIVAALEEHAVRTPQSRATLAETDRSTARATKKPNATPTATSTVVRRVHKVDQALVRLVDDALVADRRTCGRVVSRSAWISQAVDAAADAVEAAAGAPLPDPPADLPRGVPAGAPRQYRP